MPDAIASMKAGETRPVYGRCTAATGTFTISSGATYTIYDSTGAIATGHSANEAVTGQDAGALASPRVWITLNSLSPALAEGIYTVVFKFTALGTDGIYRVYEPSVLLRVLPATS